MQYFVPLNYDNNILVIADSNFSQSFSFLNRVIKIYNVFNININSKIDKR